MILSSDLLRGRCRPESYNQTGVTYSIPHFTISATLLENRILAALKGQIARRFMDTEDYCGFQFGWAPNKPLTKPIW